ncbi:MAG: diguanylate cyclase [Burkholderiales bacterium]|nr:diguanylate cyclase [Burkholderiales bacterium]
MPDPISAEALSRVCVVDDDATVLAALVAILQPAFDVRVARSGRDGLRLIRRDPPDLVLLDVNLPDVSGMAVCRRLKDDPLTEAVPVVFLTSHADEKTEVEGLDAGAADFIAKPPRGPAVLARIRNLVRMKLLAERLMREAQTDALTSLANRRRFTAALREELLRARRQERPLSVLMVDVDHFKAYNDHYGHLSGDGALRQVGQVLRGSLRRPGDLAGRLGGEEFAVLLPETDEGGAWRVAQRMLSAMADAAIPHAASATAACLSVSIGMATYRPPPRPAEPAPDTDAAADRDDSAKDLLARADAALYAAKHRGRNRACGETDVQPGQAHHTTA